MSSAARPNGPGGDANEWARQGVDQWAQHGVEEMTEREAAERAELGEPDGAPGEPDGEAGEHLTR